MDFFFVALRFVVFLFAVFRVDFLAAFFAGRRFAVLRFAFFLAGIDTTSSPKRHVVFEMKCIHKNIFFVMNCFPSNKHFIHIDLKILYHTFSFICSATPITLTIYDANPTLAIANATTTSGIGIRNNPNTVAPTTKSI